MRLVYLAAGRVDVQIVHDLLTAAGIDTVVTGLSLLGALGELPADTLPRILVTDEREYLAARTLVEAFNRQQTSDETWNCPVCDEESSTFVCSCWNCGYELPLEPSGVQRPPRGTFSAGLAAGLTLRQVENSDSAALIELVRQALGEFGLKIDLDGGDADLLAPADFYRGEGSIFWIVTRAEYDCVASCALLRLDCATVQLRTMYLEKNSRGLGLGRYLLELAINWSIEHGYRWLTLETASVLTQAVQLYERYGFVQEDTCLHAQRCDRAYRLDLIPK